MALGGLPSLSRHFAGGGTPLATTASAGRYGCTLPQKPSVRAPWAKVDFRNTGSPLNFHWFLADFHCSGRLDIRIEGKKVGKAKTMVRVA